jgi:hypothetical protein
MAFFLETTDMIDVLNEQMVKLSEAPKIVPGGPNLSTIHRWRLRGCRGKKLETILVGGIRYTSKEALQKFFEDATRAEDGDTTITPRSSQQRQRDIAAAERELEEMGI